MFASHEKQMRWLEAKEDAEADIAFAGKLQ
jgi:hypothetical protein